MLKCVPLPDQGGIEVNAGPAHRGVKGGSRATLFLLLGALLVPLVPGQASAGKLRVVLSTKTPEIPQGEPFRFSFEVRNQGKGAERVEIGFQVKRVGSKQPAMPFFRWIHVVDGNDTVTEKLSVTPSQWFAARGRFRIQTTDTPAKPLEFRIVRSPRRLPRFTDVSGDVGLGTIHHALPQLGSCDHAAGAAWGDIEGDGDLDLYLPHQTAPAQLFLNQGGTFADIAGERGVDNGGTPGIGAAFADFDNDGDQDLYVANDGPNRLYQNDGSGHFIDVAPAAGVDYDGPSYSPSWGDYDNDGLLDLYVAAWGTCGTGPAGTESVREPLTYAEDRLYHNQGDGTFSDQTQVLGPDATNGAGFQAAWFDYDHDGDQDLYLANDFLGQAPKPNVLWRNDGPDGSGSWRFTDVSLSSHTGVSINTMGIGIGDYDRNGHLDMALSNIEATVLFRNNGDGTFTDRARSARVARPLQRIFERSVTWGLAFFDFNNDSWEDLYVAAGDLYDERDPQPNALFVNRGRGRFLDLSAPSRAADPGMGRGAAFADFDRDGRMDMLVVNRGGPIRLFQNVTPPRKHHWLEVDTVGTKSNRDGCGARLSLKLDRRTTLVREVFCGSISLASGSDSTVHFGLGNVRKVKKLTIEWPSGTVQTLTKLKANQVITVTEP